MFSGIVQEVGTVLSASLSAEGAKLVIGAGKVTLNLAVGDSVSVSGVCLTAVEGYPDRFAVEVSRQTLSVTTLGVLAPGGKVNLEPALRLSDRLGGHLVSGHIDAIGVVVSVRQDGFSKVVTFAVGEEFAPLVVEKGSIAVDGVSLTVASLPGNSACAPSSFAFAVALIPHTLASTTLGLLKPGDKVNFEADLIGKYVARWVEPNLAFKVKKDGLTLSYLAAHGYTGPQ